MSATQLKKVSFWHESIIDWELANPDKSMGECAAHFNVSPSYLSIVRNCDVFQEYAAARRREHNGHVSSRVVGLVTGVAETSLEVLQERIDKERENIGLSGVLDTAGMALKALGFGIPKAAPASPATAVINLSVGGSELEEARERMRIVSEKQTVDTEDARGAADVKVLDGGTQEHPLLSPAE